ncbi:Glycerophosphodiester phosphodiesterase [Thalictrum thalictroides]|uniref:glycerophosphodiester phosphodiesterase n=1 Tax=Thalictrum thalictroides TaxID=46969 RepID=A0A7J6WRL2_THATH|nr:Glycerophosphodiester phosphodiesterase [Thalictrum thalictroides]
MQYLFTHQFSFTGDAPLVIARGGFSGLFPDSSSNAYGFAMQISLPNVVLWCDVQLTKDGVGVCLPNLVLDNGTSISGPGDKTYIVNGVSTKGFFSVDYTFEGLQNYSLVQAIFSRTPRFDDNLFPILTVEVVAQQFKPQGLWLNIQHDAFYTQHNLSMRSYVLSVSRRVVVNYVSSPEVGFLRSIVTRFRRSPTKLIFRFLEADKTDPSTNQTYGSLLKNLTFIKTFSSGILVPKNYIWPVNIDQYLQPHTSLVIDAHKEGLEVYASDFANDNTFSYNYSYDPYSEYLSFIDNGDFSVDGLLSDFPITPSAAIDCFSHISPNSTGQATPAIISHNGASGVYPDCTDLAYNQAVEDGADYIDCSIQMTSDGIPICLSSINLIDVTTVTESPFSNLAISIPDIQPSPGIFTFNLTWKDIQSLKPLISTPLREYALVRNPAYKNAGKFLSLDDFLTLAKSKRLSGIVISIKNAAYLAENKGMSITDAVLDALNKSGYNNQTAQEVIIQSTNKAVLTRLKEQSKHKRMYMVDENIRSVDDSSIKDIKSFADYVAISKDSVFPEIRHFTTGDINSVSKLKSVNLTVFVYVFRNEFVEQAWDFFADPIVEINTFVMAGEIDGVITDFPGTAAAYRRNKCLGPTLPLYMAPVQVGSLLQAIASPTQLPPAEAPYPVLTENDVAEGPLPPVSKETPTAGGTAEAPNTPSSQPGLTACIILSSLSTLLASVLLL